MILYCVFLVCFYHLVASKQFIQHQEDAQLIRQEVKETKGVNKNETSLSYYFLQILLEEAINGKIHVMFFAYPK